MLTVHRTLYLFLPLLFSVAVSAVVHRFDLLPCLARPIDGGASWRARRIFGDGKTWRGLAVAVAGSIVAVALQKHALAAAASDIAVIDYAHANPVALGLAFGTGAIVGELPNSFVKRRLGIARGGTGTSRVQRVAFWVWDQVDSISVTWLFLLPWLRPTAPLVLVSIAATLVLHPLIAFVGWVAGARESPR